MRLTCYFHFWGGIPENQSASDYACGLIKYALDRGLHPIPTPRVGLVRTILLLPKPLACRVEAVANESQLNLKDACARLAKAAINHINLPTPSRAQAPVDPRAELQDAMLAGVRDAVRTGRIALIEGGIGVGRECAIAKSAMEFLSTEKGRVVIASPNLARTVQLLREWDLAGNSPSLCGLLFDGRQFVDLAALNPDLGMLKEKGVAGTVEIEQWIRDGGPPVSEASRRLGSVVKTIRWLAEDLRQIAPGFPFGRYIFDESSAVSDATAAYAEVKASTTNSGAEVIYATHAAMFHTMGLEAHADEIPTNVGLLLINEAHSLEDSLLAISNGTFSLQRIQRLLKNEDEWKPLRLISAAKNAFKAAQQCDRVITKEVRGRIAWMPLEMSKCGQWRKLSWAFTSLKDALAPFVQRAKSGTIPPALSRIITWHKCVERAISGRELVELSNVEFDGHSFRSLTVSPVSLHKNLQQLWSNVPAAALFSGTLYEYPQYNASYSSSHMSRKFAIPDERCQLTAPVTAEWAVGLPVVHIPSPQQAPALSYPESEKDANLPAWWDAIASLIRKIATKAKGGTIVLCNSFVDIKAIAERLPGNAKAFREKVDAKRLIQHCSGTSVAQLREEFIAVYEAGDRPVCLASGPAWIELDMGIGNRDPAKDFLLTDLVIVRVPFGMNHTAPHRMRKLRYDDVEGKEAALRLRQGLDRLMRQDGVTDRHIWFLDGRIHGPKASYYKQFVRVFSEYRRNEALLEA